MDFDERINGLVREIAAEREAQLEAAKVVLRPLLVVVAIIVFALCFWGYEIGLPLSIGVAILTMPAMGLGVALPIGYILGKRAARRLKSRIRDAS
jgi:hypothetical protein